MLADPESKDAVLVDPVIELAERDAKLVSEMGLNLKYVSKYLNDHIGCRVWVYGVKLCHILPYVAFKGLEHTRVFKVRRANFPAQCVRNVSKCT